MAESIFPPNMAAMLQEGLSPERQRALTLAALLRSGALDQQGAPTAPQQMPPTMTGAENAPPIPSPSQMGFTPPQFPTAGGGAMPQSEAEAADLADQARRSRAVGEVTGFSPAMRSSEAFQQGRPLEGVGHAAVAALPYKPAAGLALAGGAYATALGQTLAPGMFGASGAEAQQPEIPSQFIPMDRSKFFQENRPARKSLEQALTDAEARVTSNPAYQGLIEDGKRTQAKRMIDEARRNAEDAYNKAEAGRGSEEARLDAAYQTYLTNLNQQRDEFMRGRSRADEDERAVRTAERVKADWEAKDKQWSDTPIGRLNEAMGGYGPMLLGGVAGGLTRSAGRVMGHGDNWMSHYAAPAVTGGFAGGSAVNAPVIYNATQPEVLNPRRRGLEEYAAALPPDHPRRAEAQGRLQDTTSLPVLNPIRREANEQLGLGPTVRRTLSGILLEGAPGGVMGSEVVRRLGNRRTGGTTGDTGGGPSGTPPPQPPTLTLEQRRRDRSYSIERNAPVAPGEVETWVSPAGNKMLKRDASGNFRDGNRWVTSPPKGWRRIAAAEPATMAEFLRG